jgi:hypothetical protein
MSMVRWKKVLMWCRLIFISFCLVPFGSDLYIMNKETTSSSADGQNICWGVVRQAKTSTVRSYHCSKLIESIVMFSIVTFCCDSNVFAARAHSFDTCPLQARSRFECFQACLQGCGILLWYSDGGHYARIVV